jgi:16S rRNA processing protein RimM
LSKNRYKAGWVKDAHGLKGELYVQLFAKRADWLSSFREFWLGEEQAVRYFVERAQPHKLGLIVKSESIQDRTSAERLKGQAFFIPISYLQSEEEGTFFLYQILGFALMDGERSAGRIADFASNGAQDLLVVENGAKRFLVPFVEAFIRNIDFDGRVIHMELPPGLEDET